MQNNRETNAKIEARSQELRRAISKTTSVLGTAFLGTALAIAVPYPAGPDHSSPLMASAQTREQLLEAADRLERLGVQKLQEGDPNATVQAWQQALAIYRQVQARNAERRLLENFGSLFIQFEAYENAVEALQLSYELARSLEDKAAGASVLVKLGRAHRALGNVSQAVGAYQLALAFSQEIGDNESQLVAAGSLGNIAFNNDNYAQAAEFFNRAWFAARQVGDRSRELQAVQAMASSYYLLGQCEFSQAFYGLSLQIVRETGDRSELVSLLKNHGAAAYCNGDFERALASYEEGLTLARELQDKSQEFQLLGNIGLVYVHLGRYEEAIDFLQQDLAAARELGERQVEGQALGSLGDAYFFQANYQQAVDYYRQSLEIAREVDYTRGVGLMLSNIGASLYQLQKLPEAETALRESVQVLEDFRETAAGSDDAAQITLMERHVRAYRMLQAVLVAQDRPEAALEASEAGRARAFARFLATQRSPATANRRAQIELAPPTLDEIRQIAATQNATIVEYAIIYDYVDSQKARQLLTWVVQPNGNIAFQKTDLEAQQIEITDLIARARKAMGVGDRAGIALQQTPGSGTGGDGASISELKQLYQLILAPIAEFLPDNPEAIVAIVPQDNLFLVPFVALQDESGTYAIDQHTLITIPSIQVLELTRQQRNTRGIGGSLVVGNPVMPEVIPAPGEEPQPLTNLPGAEAEAKAIAQLLQTDPLVGSEASKANILEKMQSARTIHFATHGLLDVGPDGLLNSRIVSYQGFGGALALTPTPGDSGLLTVEEILQLELENADLVVLSACDTGRGRIVGDGVLGLSRAFISAGAPSLVVSLWQVPDAPTATLMKEFYRQMEQDANKARALRQAMLSTKDQHPHPRDWAAFTLVGQSQ